MSGTDDHPIDRASGFGPILMSLLALLAVAKAVTNYEQFGPPAHEDGPWHLFALAMLVQPPVIFYFVFRWRRELRKMLPVLATQLSLWAVSLGAAYYLTGLY